MIPRFDTNRPGKDRFGLRIYRDSLTMSAHRGKDIPPRLTLLSKIGAKFLFAAVTVCR